MQLSFVPLSLEDGQFAATEIPEAEIPQAPPSPPRQAWKKRTHGHTSSLNDVQNSPSRPVSSNANAPPVVSQEEGSVVAVKVVKEKTNGAVHLPSLQAASQILHTAVEEPSLAINSSSVAIGTPAEPSNNNMTAMDFVRRMQQRSNGSSPVSQKSPDSAKKHVQPSLPSVYNTPFAPTANEHAQLSPRLENAQRRSPSFTTPNVNSSAAFQENIAQQQRDIQLRSSPQAPFQATPSWFVQTPSGMNTFINTYENQQERASSPFASPQAARSPHTKSPAQHAPFGVIGQARPLSRGAPTNG